MVAQQPQLQIQTQQPTPSPQDEALKRNTDCVYFLASPLTCKKGNECEYRHSEYARMNPRDCYYWLNGNCLNPKCAFRHPPLDGLLGTPPAGAAAGPSVPVPQIATTSATHAPYNNTSSKQAVPCIFFQKGFCLKGDRCAFMHGPIPNNGSKIATQGSLTNQGAENPSFKKPFGGIEKHTQERKTSQGNAAPVVRAEAKPVQKFETAPQKNTFRLEKHVPPPSARFDNEASRFKTTSSPPPATNGPNVARSNRVHQPRLPDDHSFHSGKDSDEFLRESSPGFDVLVADELRNSDYYHGEDEFGKARGQDERGLDSLNEYDTGRSADYNLAADIDRDRFRAPQGYDSYDHVQDPYGWEPRKASTHIERRTRHRSGSPESGEVSDLRHRLSKRRKGNGLKSVVTHDYAHESHGEDHGHRFSRKDSLQLPSNERSVNNRFRGRINLPPNGDGHLERDLDRGRISSRLSSGGRPHAPHQGRIQDRIRGRFPDDERRDFRGRSIGDRSGFSGPKSLSELKHGRNTENNELPSFGKRKSFRDQQQFEDDVPFEGPKPLSEILKEKKGSGSGAASSQGSKSAYNKNEGITENGTLSESKEEETKIQAADGVGREVDNTDVIQGQSSEDGMIYDEAAEYQEYEGDELGEEGDYEYEQGDEEYDYEQVDEGENQEQEYIEGEDGDDFAKKIGVVLS